MEVADAHSYLGIQLIMKEGSVQVNMQYFIEKLLQFCGEEELQECVNPAGKDFFTVDKKSPVLGEKMRRLFHTHVAKLLYLKKTRSSRYYDSHRFFMYTCYQGNGTRSQEAKACIGLFRANSRMGHESDARRSSEP